MYLSFYYSELEIDNDNDFKEEEIKTSLKIDKLSINVNQEKEGTNDSSESNIITGKYNLIIVS